ncbi:hypothetical protein [Georgenia daeguensis]|uniref:Uncharacterized protein n=1 Tax=Georgenia daeguensis TaxID=908355 RepID=A0ABP8EYM9_9MICO
MVIWQLRAGARARQRPAPRAIAVTFYALAAYVVLEPVRDLLTQDKAGESLLGIVLERGRPGRDDPGRDGAAADRAGPGQSGAGGAVHRDVDVQRRVGDGPGRAQLNAVLGWWWADPAVALVVAAAGFVGVLAAQAGMGAS